MVNIEDDMKQNKQELINQIRDISLICLGCETELDINKTTFTLCQDNKIIGWFCKNCFEYLIRKRKIPGNELYQCPTCNGNHITKSGYQKKMEE